MVVVSQLALDVLTGCPHWLLTLVLQHVLLTKRGGELCCSGQFLTRLLARKGEKFTNFFTFGSRAARVMVKQPKKKTCYSRGSNPGRSPASQAFLLPLLDLQGRRFDFFEVVYAAKLDGTVFGGKIPVGETNLPN